MKRALRGFVAASFWLLTVQPGTAIVPGYSQYIPSAAAVHMALPLPYRERR